MIKYLHVQHTLKGKTQKTCKYNVRQREKTIYKYSTKIQFIHRDTDSINDVNKT